METNYFHMSLIRKILTENFFVIALILLEIVLFVTNFKPGTFFVGWDNLLPELNFKANFARSFFGVWQQYRGLGFLDGMSFVANLVHYIFIFLLSFFLPINLLRYVFVFLMHLLGGIGMYFLLKKKLTLTSLISFCGSLFYMFNLATIQMFYAPYELFLVHFAFLPFLVNSLINLLENKSLKNILIFSLFTFLSTPQSHVPTIFIVYLLMVLTILIHHLLIYKKILLKNSLLAICIVFIFNSFWLLPFIYSAFNRSSVVLDSKINQLTNEDVFTKNKQRGKLLDVLYLKGFMLDEVEMQKNGRIEFIMQSWRFYLESTHFKIISTLLLQIFLLGLITSIVAKKSLVPFLIVLLISFIFLANNIPILKNLTDFLRNNSSLFREIFRFTFTKFSIMFVFCMTIIFSYGLKTLQEFLSKYLPQKKFMYVFPVSIIMAIVIYSWPSFQGHFLYDSLRVKIPDEYFQTINFFKSQNENTRIAAFPMPTYWNWKFYNFGARGSGFIWYGIPQAYTDRAFDPWSSENENFYWEISYAIYSKRVDLMEKLAEKYQLTYLLLDKNIINPLSPKTLYLNELEQMFSQSEKFIPDQQYGNIKIYKVKLNTPVKDFTFLASGLPNIGPRYYWNNLDKAFLTFGHYQTSKGNSDYYFPYRSLFTGKRVNQKEFNILEDQNSFSFVADLPPNLSSSLNLPDQTASKLTYIDSDNLSQLAYLLPEVKSDGKKISTQVPKVGGQYASLFNPAEDPVTKKALKCENFEAEEGMFIQYTKPLDNQKGLRLIANRSGSCRISFWLQHASHQNAYLVTVNSRHIKGRTIYMWIENVNIQRPEIEAYLPSEKDFKKSYFILPPLEKSGLSYTLHFDNVASLDNETINDLADITVAPISYDYLTGINFGDNKENATTAANFSPSHPNSATYLINLEGNVKNNTLVLSQAFDQGWIALSFSGISFNSLNDHQLINNWANGWRIENDGKQKIVIFYLPQLLEFLGFLLILMFIFYLLRRIFIQFYLLEEHQ